MKTISVRSGIASIVTAVVLLPQISPALAGTPTEELALTQGSRPGMPEPSRESERNKRRGPVVVTYTKWVLPNSTLMEGFTGGHVPGDFVGEVLQRQVSQDYDPDPDVSTAGRIIRLEAIYEAKAGSRSFTALIRGGQNSAGAAVLDGVILRGWRTGARVHVEFQRTLAPSPTESGCVGAPPGLNCFEGTIDIERAPEQ